MHTLALLFAKAPNRQFVHNYQTQSRAEPVIEYAHESQTLHFVFATANARPKYPENPLLDSDSDTAVQGQRHWQMA